MWVELVIRWVWSYVSGVGDQVGVVSCLAGDQVGVVSCGAGD